MNTNISDQTQILIEKIKSQGIIKEVNFNIKVGKKIRCINPYGMISLGKKYKIIDIINNKYFEGLTLLELEGIEGKYFRADSFEQLTKSKEDSEND